jgi:hypothetical protein
VPSIDVARDRLRIERSDHRRSSGRRMTCAPCKRYLNRRDPARAGLGSALRASAHP